MNSLSGRHKFKLKFKLILKIQFESEVSNEFGVIVVVGVALGTCGWAELAPPGHKIFEGKTTRPLSGFPYLRVPAAQGSRRPPNKPPWALGRIQKRPNPKASIHLWCQCELLAAMAALKSVRSWNFRALPPGARFLASSM